MTKKIILISSIFLFLAGIFSFGFVQFVQYSKPNSKAILGAFESISSVNSSKSIFPKVVVQQNLPPITPAENDQSAQSQTPQSLSITLQGNGCGQNSRFEETCFLVQSTGVRFGLKVCTENDLDTCNFYAYSLGRKTADTQYIIQRYEENGDILVDILAYSISKNSSETLQTVLFQTINDGSSDAKAGNQQFTDVLREYS
jgi:hypothetical protein